MKSRWAWIAMFCSLYILFHKLCPQHHEPLVLTKDVLKEFNLSFTWASHARYKDHIVFWYTAPRLLLHIVFDFNHDLNEQPRFVSSFY